MIAKIGTLLHSSTNLFPYFLSVDRFLGLGSVEVMLVVALLKRSLWTQTLLSHSIDLKTPQV